jgi:hypothetical protein
MFAANLLLGGITLSHMSTTKWKLLAGQALVFIGTTIAQGAVVDFETVFGAVPHEGMLISNQFAGTFGMTFSGSNALVIAQRGTPRTAFGSASGGDDALSPTNTHDCGDFFLVAPETAPLTVRFASPVSTFSFYVLDLDDTERVTLIAYTSEAASGVRTNVFRSTDPSFGDGLAGLASVSIPSNAISRVEVRLSDSDLTFGAAYDDFSSDYTPPPPTPARLDFQLPNRLTIVGDVGRTYRVDYADTLDLVPTSTNWHALTTIILPTSPHLYLDSAAPSSGSRFYRAVGTE